MNYELTGRVHHIGQPETHGSYTKRMVVLDDQADKYPQQIAVEFGGKAMEAVANVKVGDIVTVTFNLRGREWNGKWFVNLSGWKIQVSANDAPGADEPMPSSDGGTDELLF
jgi:single-strand DNA-binding protein